MELSETGRGEAAQTGHVLWKEGFDFDCCYTSCLKRAIHTAGLVLEALGQERIPVERASAERIGNGHYVGQNPTLREGTGEEGALGSAVFGKSCERMAVIPQYGCSAGPEL